MKRGLSFLAGLLVLCAAAPSALAGGALKVEFPDASPERVKKLRVEILDVGKQQQRLAFKSDAGKIPADGISLGAGTYHVYVEDRETGLIVRLDKAGAGYVLKDEGVVNVEAGDIVARVRAVKDKDATERHANAEKLKQRPVKVKERPRKTKTGAPEAPAGPDASAVADAPPAPTEAEEEHAPGELLLKFQPGTTLADRYDIISELSAESRSKLDQLDVYRVKVSDAVDLPAVIAQFADDPRVKYMEMNMTVSVPEPVLERNIGSFPTLEADDDAKRNCLCSWA